MAKLQFTPTTNLLKVESNLITGFATETTLTSIEAQTEKLQFTDTTNYLKTQNQNNITGFALETTQTAIEEQTAKLQFTPTTNLLKVESNLITGFATETTLTSIEAQTEKLQFTETNNYLKTQIQNASIDSHCYGSNNGTTWHHLKTNANGILSTHSLTQDAEGNDITSTLVDSKRGLDVNLIGGNISSVNIKDSSGNSLSAVSDTIPQLKTTLYDSSGSECGTSSKPLTVGLATTANTIKIDPSNNTIKLSNGVNTASVLGTISNLNTAMGLVCNSAVYGLNLANGDVGPITVSLFGDKNQLDVKDNDTNTTLISMNDKLYTTTNNNSIVGLNMYQILPKIKTYTQAGRFTNTTNGLMGGNNSTQTFTSLNWGKSNGKTFYASMNGTSRTLSYEYVDIDGNTGVNTVVAPTTGWSSALTLEGGVSGVGKIVSINKWFSATSLGTSDTVFFTHAVPPATPTSANTIAGGEYGDYYCGVMTVPNNCIMYITNVFSSISGAGVLLWLVKWDAITGARTTVWNYVAPSAGSLNLSASGATEGATIGGFFYAGESFGWGRSLSASNDLCATVVCRTL
jgi:hypothetical protein